MIICLSGFVIAGLGGRSADAACCRAAGPAGARYSPPHQALLAQLAGRGSSSSESVSSASPPRARRVRTLYACLGESEGELSFEPNQIISNVCVSGEPGWLRGELAGRTGLVPENYVEPLP